MKHIKVVPSFFNKADKLKEHYKQCFNNPLEATENRFVWDNWHVEGQYSLTRTPAYHFFPEDLYEEFHKALTLWGQKNLGCMDISPPWLSYYTDGAFQEWHADVPHGPWAFVYSITDWQNRNFSGGETKILKPNTLNFWQNFDSSHGLEKPQIVENIPADFNQLTVFDPRLPHGVEKVHGNRDPLQARIVIHGWFTNPKPLAIHFSDEEKLENHLNEILPLVFDETGEIPDVTGVLVFNLKITPEGRATEVTEKTNNLISRQNIPGEIDVLVDDIQTALLKQAFLTNSKPYEVVLPLIFESEPM